MFIKTGNPTTDYLLYDAERENKLEKMPRCVDCGNRIQDAEFYFFKIKIPGQPLPMIKFVCEECLSDCHKVSANDYHEDLEGY